MNNTKNPVGRPTKPKQREEKPAFLTVDAGPSDSIGDVSRRAVKLADANKCPVRFVFQGIAVEALPEEDIWDPANRWFALKKKGAA
jgi:hypothetical protein